MATVSNPYDTLLSNLQNAYTYVENGYECSLGESMLLKAKTSNEPESMLPVETTYVKDNAFTAVVAYVNDRLSVTAAPKKNNTMRSFPVRSSFSAVFSSIAACLVIFSFGIFDLAGNNICPLTADNSETEVVETEENENLNYELQR